MYLLMLLKDATQRHERGGVVPTILTGTPDSAALALERVEMTGPRQDVAAGSSTSLSSAIT